MMPATSVPCEPPWVNGMLGYGLQAPGRVQKQLLKTRCPRSGWFEATPLSMTATTMSDEPVVTVQAASARMRRMCHCLEKYKSSTLGTGHVGGQVVAAGSVSPPSDSTSIAHASGSRRPLS